MDSNHRPTDYESAALTAVLRALLFSMRGDALSVYREPELMLKDMAFVVLVLAILLTPLASAQSGPALALLFREPLRDALF
jgi:hypothetical protein